MKIEYNAPMLLVDAHEDLAYNILTFGRDYTRSAAETRHAESGSQIYEQNGDTLLGWPDFQRGQVALIFATLFAAPQRAREGDWDTQCYKNADEARHRYRLQADVYHRLCDEYPAKFRLARGSRDVRAILAGWENPSLVERPVGLILLMEGAEGVRSPDELQEWWELGVRIIGPAWRGNAYCGGTREPGPLTRAGYALLDAMASIGFTLDISHMDERAALQALEHYPGAIIASHANAAALLKGAETNRHLSDAVLRSLIERGAVIGVVPYNKFLLPGWKRADGREIITLQHLAAHIDYICQLSGDAAHAGIGSDFDGGLGLQDVPAGLDTIADLRKLIPLLAEKGYSEADIASVMGQNWITLLERALPPNSR